jgi:hypothetical protein
VYIRSIYNFYIWEIDPLSRDLDGSVEKNQLNLPLSLAASETVRKKCRYASFTEEHENHSVAPKLMSGVASVPSFTRRGGTSWMWSTTFVFRAERTKAERIEVIKSLETQEIDQEPRKITPFAKEQPFAPSTRDHLDLLPW